MKIISQRRFLEIMEAISNSLFPIKMGMHVFLGLLALLVFGLQFIRYRKWHYLVLAIAFPCTLLPYLVDSMSFFYGLGVGEFAALILSFVLSCTIDKTKDPEPETENAENLEKTEENVS